MLKSSYSLFFSKERPDFFRPLSGKYREVTVYCLRQLYLRLCGPDADYRFHPEREDILNLFHQAVENAPIFNNESDDDSSELPSPREQASFLLNRLRQHGWLEQYQDPVSLKTAYRLTPDGRLFAKSLSEVGHKPIKTGQRNVRQTRNCLKNFLSVCQSLQTPDVHDLIDAQRYSEDIVNDFNESIEEINQRRRELVRAAEDELKARQVSEDFFEFMEKGFRSEVGKKFSVDSVIRYKEPIEHIISQIKHLEDEQKARIEQDLRRQWPALLKNKDNSILFELLNRIQQRLQAACEIKQPELRACLEAFTRQADLLIRQLAQLQFASQGVDIQTLFKQLGELDYNKREQCLLRATRHYGVLDVALIDPKANKLRQRDSKRSLVDTLIQLPEPDKKARKQVFIREQLAKALCIDNQTIIDYVVQQLQNKAFVDTDQLKISNVSDLFAHLNVISVSKMADGEFEFSISANDKIMDNTYFTGKSFRIEIKELIR